MQYILGKAWFWGLTLQVSPDVLIPRPETEQLLELALRYCAEEDTVLDCCTGSGAIALALKIQRPDAIVHASDISAAALEVARANAADLQLELEFHLCDLFPDNAVKYDLIVSNPPYVSQAEYEVLEAVVKDNEPASALLSGLRAWIISGVFWSWLPLIWPRRESCVWNTGSCNRIRSSKKPHPRDGNSSLRGKTWPTGIAFGVKYNHHHER